MRYLNFTPIYTNKNTTYKTPQQLQALRETHKKTRLEAQSPSYFMQYIQYIT